MIKNILFSLAVAFTVFACSQKTTEQMTQDGHQYFGEKIESDEAVSLAQLVNKMEGVDSMQVKVRGTVEGVCQKKGCWMNIVSSETDEQMFVKFKDYGFFVPTDIAGKEVIMDGYAFREVTSVDELRHYAEDDGKSPEEVAKITEPKEEFKFMASGVILVDEDETE
ncbi:MAG: DUF4920 domain-containing protein [Bacteroidota bacterium]